MNIRAKIFGGNSEQPGLIRAKAPKGARTDKLNGISVKREESRRVNTREDDRHRLLSERVDVVHKRKSYAVTLVNLSGGGAMIEGALAAKLWDPIELKLGTDGSIECAVCWAKDGRFGLEFAHETRLDCSPEEQARILREVIARSFPTVEFEASKRVEEPVTPKASDKRGGRRHPLIWSGTLHHDFDSHQVRVRNISSTGAMIEGVVGLTVRGQPLLELGGLQLPAKVSWAVGDAAGLRFDSEFDLSQLAQARPEVATRDWKRPSYLEGKLSDPAAEDRWQHMSLGELREELEGFWKY